MVLDLGDHRLDPAPRNRRGSAFRPAARPCRGRRSSRRRAPRGRPPSTMRRARPSAMAVLPTPGSPTNSGLFLDRRQRIWIVRSTSSRRPINGSIFPFSRLLVQVDAVGLEGVAALLAPVLGLVLLGAPRGAVLGHAGDLRDAVRDEADRVEPGHVLLLKVVDRVRFAFGEHGDEHVGAGDLLAPRRLDVYQRPLDDALEPRGGLGTLVVVVDRPAEVVVQVRAQVLAQRLDIDAAGPQNGDGVVVFGQGQQEMLERRVFVATPAGERQRPVKALLKAVRETRHVSPSPSCIAGDAGSGGRYPSPGRPWSRRSRRCRRRTRRCPSGARAA